MPTTSHLRSAIDEYGQAGSSMEQAASLRDFADKPLVLLTAGAGQDAGWLEDQEALSTLSTDSVHRVVEGVNHGGLVGDQEGAAASTRAILDVVTSVRAAPPPAR